MVINSVVSGYFYVDHRGFGIPYLPNSKCNLYTRTYSSHIRIQAYKKPIWISKYGQT